MSMRRLHSNCNRKWSGQEDGSRSIRVMAESHVTTFAIVLGKWNEAASAHGTIINQRTSHVLNRRIVPFSWRHFRTSGARVVTFVPGCCGVRCAVVGPASGRHAGQLWRHVEQEQLAADLNVNFRYPLIQRTRTVTCNGERAGLNVV